MEDLIESEALSSNIATKEQQEEEEWDAEASFAMEVRDSDTSTRFIVLECDDDDEDWEILSDKEEDTRDIKIDPSLHEDEPQEYGGRGSIGDS